MNSENRIAAYDISISDVVRAGGYYDRFGLWNSIVEMDGRLLRGRVEVFIFKDDKIFAGHARSGLLRIPGGSFTKGVPNEVQCYLEAKEEARILIKNVEYSGYHYIRIYDKIYTSHEKNFIPCDGTYNEVYIAEYEGDYDGYIKPIDADKNMYETGDWYTVEELYVKLPPNQQKFLEMRFPDKVANLPKNPEVVEEGVKDSAETTTIEKEDKSIKGVAIGIIRNLIAKSDFEYDNGLISIEYNAPKDIVIDDDLYIGRYSFRDDIGYDNLRRLLAVANDELNQRFDGYFIPIPDESSKNGILRVSKMGQIGESTFVKTENIMFPYYLPSEMEKLGVFNQGHNLYAESAMDEKSVSFMRKYKENLFAGVDQDWYKTLIVRYTNFKEDPSDYNKQALLDLGWNPEIPVTPETVVKVSAMTKKRLTNETFVDLIGVEEGFIDRIREVIRYNNWKRKAKQNDFKALTDKVTPYRRKKTSSKADMDRFYRNNDFCVQWVSGDEELCQIIANQLGSRYEIKTPVDVYVISGKDMNKIYDLHGDNAYQNDVYHVVVPLDVLKNKKDTVAAKSTLGARYFNDIVDNNEYREYVAGRHKYSKQIQWLIDFYNESTDESYVEEDSKESKYKYEKITDSKDVDNFHKCMKKVFNTESDMMDDEVRKNMKLIKLDGKVIGYIGFSTYTISNKKYLGFGNFMILPEYQRSGYGTSVINDIIEKNKSKYDEIYCYVSEDNKKAISFYKKIAKVSKTLNKDGQYYVTIYKKSHVNESYVEETSVKSNIDKDFKSKGSKSLSEFHKETITSSFISKYKSDYKFLRHVDPSDKSYAFLDKDGKIVGIVSVDDSHSKDDYNWITAIEVTSDYRGYGLGNKLLEFAVKTLHANALSVNKKNDVAIRMYKNYGFKIKTDTDSMHYMYLNESHVNESQANLSNFTWYHAEVKRPGFNPKIAGGWDEELYSKDIESCINNDIKYNQYAKDKDKVEAHLYTAGEELKAIYLGIITVYKHGDSFDWEWSEQEPISSELVSYLKDEVHKHLLEDTCIESVNIFPSGWFSGYGDDVNLDDHRGDIIEEMKRSTLPDEVFGIPELRKYPMPDKKHVLSAIRFFNHVEYKYERQLANKIIANMKKYNIDASHIGKGNRLRNYLPKDMREVAEILEEAFKLVNIKFDKNRLDDMEYVNDLIKQIKNLDIPDKYDAEQDKTSGDLIFILAIIGMTTIVLIPVVILTLVIVEYLVLTANKKSQLDKARISIDKIIKKVKKQMITASVEDKKKYAEYIDKLEKSKTALNKAMIDLDKKEKSKNKSAKSSQIPDGHIKIGNGSIYCLGVYLQSEDDDSSVYMAKNYLKDWKKKDYTEYKKLYFEDDIAEIAFAKFNEDKLMRYIKTHEGNMNDEIDEYSEGKYKNFFKGKTVTNIYNSDSEYIVYCKETNSCYIINLKLEDCLDKVSIQQLLSASNKAYNLMLKGINSSYSESTILEGIYANTGKSQTNLLFTKNFVFDLGNVLVSTDFDKALLDCGVPSKHIEPVKNAWLYGKSTLTEIMSLGHRMKIAKSQLPAELHQYLDSAAKASILSVKPYSYTVDLLKHLKDAGYKLYYLSNWDWWSCNECIKAGIFDFLKYFDGGIFSWEVGCMKPNHDIYNALCDKFKLIPSECMFFDDKEENIAAAKELYMGVFVFDHTKTPEFITTQLLNTLSLLSENADELHEDFLSQKSKPVKNQKAHVKYLKAKRKKHINNKATSVNTVPGAQKASPTATFSFQNASALLEDDLFNYLIESNTKEGKRPVFIVTSWTNTPFGKLIAKWTKSTFTHAAIGFDTALDKLYSYNADNKLNKFGGFSIESIQNYREVYEDAKICVSVFFVKNSDFEKIKQGAERLQNNMKKTTYDFMNIINIIFNKAISVGAKGQEALSFVCSEFVAWLIKLADINLVDKPINLITPKDLSNLTNPKIYKLYEGYIADYDKSKIDRIFKNLKKRANIIKEAMIEEYLEMKK